ncbi:disulfide bond formation protein B [Candidatus Parcubacteria bacterium]|nr:disulfide bond formation protein B [Candidatus Parcubacteria bacterium]
MTSGELITSIFSWGTLFAHIIIVIFVFCLLIRNRIADQIVSWVGRNVLTLSFLLVLSGLVGSLLYSEFVGFEPCVLCWVARIFLYPQVVLLGLAFWRKDKNIIPYIYSLSILGAIVTLYHSFTQLGGSSFTPCTAVGGACSKMYVLEFGYITIPMMAFTVFLMMILTFVAAKKQSKIVSLK